MWFEDFIYPKLPLIASVLCCIIPLAGLFYTPEELFPYLNSSTVYMVYVFFASAALFCRFFYMMRRLYSSVRAFSMNEENPIPPEGFYTFSHTFRFIGCAMLAGYYKLLWALLFFSPSAICGIILADNILKEEGMLAGVFLIFLLLTFALFLTGAVFYITVKQRYALVLYLLYINPREPPDSIISSSVLLTRGKLIRLALIKVLLKISAPAKIIPPAGNFLNRKRAEFIKMIYEA